MILKMEKICKNYIDQLENGGEHFNIQNFMIMYIFGACNNTEYRTKLFDHWPTVSKSYLRNMLVLCNKYIFFYSIWKILPNVSPSWHTGTRRLFVTRS